MAERSLLATQPATLRARLSSRRAACLSIHAPRSSAPRASAPCQAGRCTHHSGSSQKDPGCRGPGEPTPAPSCYPRLPRRGLLSRFPNLLFPEWRKRTSPLGKQGVAVGLEVRLGRSGENSLPLTKEVEAVWAPVNTTEEGGTRPVVFFSLLWVGMRSGEC